ncbi:MAG: 2-oxoacid:acceptor oxidoreductase family protein [Anaerolineales bacterium]|nr:2-oxoacid:acceptor oxidoreductase family protein [Anaerolineales bacterium]
MDNFTEITWYGRGGQGVVTAGKVLAETALESGRYFQSAPEYGPERAGAPIRAYTRLSDEPITLHSSIESPDVVVVLDSTVIGPVDVTAGIKSDGLIIVNTPDSPAKVRKQLGLESGRVATIDATRIAIDEIGRDITNTPLLGAFAATTGIFSVEDIVDQTRSRFGKKMAPAVVEANVRAIQRAAREVQEG